jgi:Rrf2 family protein
MLSKKTQYALKALGLLAKHYGKGPLLIQDIAADKHIPIKFLENILLELKKANILDSKKGRGGGYFLKDSPEKTSLAKVMRTVEGPIALLPCVSLYFYEKCADCNEEHCAINAAFIEARDAILGVLEHKTLLEL